ncbi:hypothetical protein MASR2M12_12070 [Bacteroidales bacterium]
MKVLVENYGVVETNDEGIFKLTKLEPDRKYFFTLNTESFLPVDFQFSTYESDLHSVPSELTVIKRPMFTGVNFLEKGKYTIIKETPAYRYYLNYALEPETDFKYLPLSGSGRFVGWYLREQQLQKFVRGSNIVLWDVSQFSFIAPLSYHSKRIIKSSNNKPFYAEIPSGWFIGLDSLTIIENTEGTYPFVNYHISKRDFSFIQKFSGKDYIILSANLEPGKYALIPKDLNWDKNSSYPNRNGVTPVIVEKVYAFEIVEK